MLHQLVRTLGCFVQTSRLRVYLPSLLGSWVSVTILWDQSYIKAWDPETKAGFCRQRDFTYVPGYVWRRITMFWKCSYRLRLVTGGGDHVQVTLPSVKIISYISFKSFELIPQASLKWPCPLLPASHNWLHQCEYWLSHALDWFFLLKIRM